MSISAVAFGMLLSDLDEHVNELVAIGDGLARERKGLASLRQRLETHAANNRTPAEIEREGIISWLRKEANGHRASARAPLDEAGIALALAASAIERLEHLS